MRVPWIRESDYIYTHLTDTHYSRDVGIEVGGLWVKLQQQDADVVQQWLAAASVSHLRQLTQVTQLKPTGLVGSTKQAKNYFINAASGCLLLISWGVFKITELQKYNN